MSEDRAQPVRRRRLRDRVLADELLVLEAAFALGLARLALLLPYRHYQRWLALRVSGAVPAPELAQRVARAVRRAARVVPWSAVCLPQAMAAKLMLQRRRIDSQLVLGAQVAGRPQLLLHAWIEVDGRILLGAAGAANCVTLNRYGD